MPPIAVDTLGTFMVDMVTTTDTGSTSALLTESTSACTIVGTVVTSVVRTTALRVSQGVLVVILEAVTEAESATMPLATTVRRMEAAM
jgi:hypothetical protein